MTGSPARLGRALLAGVAGLALTVAPVASAATSPIPGTLGAASVSGAIEPTRPAFYTPPATISGAPGTIIRSEDATSVLDPLGVSTLVATAKRVMYVSRDRLARPIVVTGVVVVPRTPWLGWTPRPLVSYAVGTQGMADRCAPSRQLAEGVEYEGLGFGGLIASGYAVALTDYQGLGTPGTHTYMNRTVQGQAVLDMARAALRLPGTGLSGSSPLGLMGYSQGGGAAAAAAELQPTYAPELRLKAVAAGAVPADLAAVGTAIDGGTWAAFLGYATLGLSAGYDVAPSTFLNSAGQAWAKRLEGSCLFDFPQFAFTNSSAYSANGKPLPDYFTRAPWNAILADNALGARKSPVPSLVVHSALDDTIPYAVGKTMAQKWCAQGSSVYFSTNITPSHAGGMINYVAESQPFLAARFAGLPMVSNCGAF